MFKLIALVFAALFAIAAARPGYLASSPVVYSSHYVQPIVKTHYSVPVIKTVAVAPVVHTSVVHSIATPVVHASPIVHAEPLYHHSYGAVPVVQSYASGYGAWKK